jgi:hypothetical protein
LPVRIESRWQGAAGVGSFFERLFAPRVLRRIYADDSSGWIATLAAAPD